MQAIHRSIAQHHYTSSKLIFVSCGWSMNRGRVIRMHCQMFTIFQAMKQGTPRLHFYEPASPRLHIQSTVLPHDTPTTDSDDDLKHNHHMIAWGTMVCYLMHSAGGYFWPKGATWPNGLSLIPCLWTHRITGWAHCHCANYSATNGHNCTQ